MKPTHLQNMKALAKIQGRSILPGVKMPRKIKRKKETKPRKKYNREEKILERKILSHVNLFPHMIGIKFGDMAGTYTYNTDYMYSGLTDTLIINLKRKKFTWLECKIKEKDRELKGKQKEFQDICITCNQDHLVALSLEDVLHLI